jgi:hypothetical protein
MALLRQMTGHTLASLGVWLAVFALISLSGAVVLQGGKYAQTTGLARFAQLFWKCLPVFLAAEGLMLIALRWSGQDPGFGKFSKAFAIVFTAVPVVIGGLGVASLVKGRDPWEYLPGGPPFALREFAAKHPSLYIETVGALGGTTVNVTHGSSPLRVVFDESELREAALTWDACSDASEPQRLGGPPPFPNSRCLARIEFRHPDWDTLSEEDLDRDVAPPIVHTVRYVYSVGWEVTGKVTDHFVRWAKSVGAEPNVYGYLLYWLEVPNAGKTWTIQIRGKKRLVDDVYVEYKESATRHPR